MSKYIFRFLIFLILIAGVAEVVLRYKYGFCNSPLYISDPDFEYIYAPNQEVKRFGNVIKTNSLSMRSAEVSPDDSLVILLIGDSVINGGNLTDHDNMASTILEKRFLKDFGKKVRVLNISAGSWGPDNIAAYLKRYGTFYAKLICQVTSSHDAHDIMTHQNLVGVDPSWPDKQYKIALVELWERYRWIFFYEIEKTFFPAPQSDQKKEIQDKKKEIQQTIPDPAQKDSIKKMELNEAGIRKAGIEFDPGYEEIYQIAKADSIPFFIYLHPETSEVELGKYNDQGEEIIEFAKKRNIRLIDELNLGVKLKYYRKMDLIHYNDEGQIFLADNLYPLFIDYLNLKK